MLKLSKLLFPAPSSSTAMPAALLLGMGIGPKWRAARSPQVVSAPYLLAPATRETSTRSCLLDTVETGLPAVFMSLLVLVVVGFSDIASAQTIGSSVSEARIQEAIKSGWPKAAPDWLARLQQDETMKACSASNNAPSPETDRAIRNRERATIKYPADGNLVGDWKKGERIAQSGYGLRFTDYPPAQPNGGNCYACHQLDPKEVSYGTIGPSLAGYGKIRKFGAPFAKAVYDKIYNAHESQACSLMPRFGTNGILSEEQIKDLVALLMSPESPVNK
jgi:sulfur-oxidizing protein SoxX